VTTPPSTIHADDAASPGRASVSPDAKQRSRVSLSSTSMSSSSDGPPGMPGRRIRSIGPGSILGEMALLSGAPRSAWVHAETPVRVRELGREALDETPVRVRALGREALDEFTELRPHGAARLLRNVCGILGGWIRDASPAPDPAGAGASSN
jgi:hypothetical protein